MLIRIYRIEDDTEPWFHKSARMPLIILARTKSGIFSITLPERAHPPRDLVEVVYGEPPYDTAKKALVRRARELLTCIKKKGYPASGYFYGTFNPIHPLSTQDKGYGSRIGICYCPQEATPAFVSVSIEDIEFDEEQPIPPTRFEREDVI